MSEALKTALREACAELRALNDNLHRFTLDGVIEAWERLTNEPEPTTIAELGGQAGTSYAGGSFPAPVQDERVPTDDEVEMTRVRYAASCDQPAIILRPGDESPPRPCCARVGQWWCVAPKGHKGPCEVPPDRELPAVDFGPRAATSTRRGG